MNESKPYQHCEKCDLYKSSKCHVAFKFQRLPRLEHGLGMCKKLKEKK